MSIPRCEFFACLLLGMALFGCWDSGVPRVTAEEARRLSDDGLAVLVDVREKNEIDAGMAQDALWLPKSRIDSDPEALDRFLAEIPEDKQVLVYCRSGKRAGRVGRRMIEKGRTVGNLGGYRDWVAAGLPTEKP